jgi:membrane dipeptidase
MIARADDVTTRAKKLHADAIVVDTHLDAPDQLASKWADVATRGSTDHFDIPRAREGGLTAPFFSIYVAASYADNGAAKRALELIDITHRVVDGHPKDMVLAAAAADIRAAKQAGKLAILMGIEGGHAIEDSLAVLREMYRAGVRYMTLTHTNTNHWADSSGPFYEPDFDPKKSAVHDGLTAFGKDVVKEMNRLGMIVDISHVSDKTFYDTLAVTTKPVIASHSSCRALSDVPRNMTDEMIAALGRNRGVIGINFGAGFVSAKDAAALRQRIGDAVATEPAVTGRALDEFARADYLKEYGEMKPAAATLDDAVAHIAHAVKVAGVDHVGIGSDWDGINMVPVGLEDVSKMPALTAALLERGFSEEDVRKILGGNFLRVMREVTGK